MSSFQAIGGVSSTLQALLRDRMELPSPMLRTDLQVTIGMPLPEQVPPAAESAQVNLFLYRATENPALKNQMIPGQGHPSEYGDPPLSLVLHYLLTAYGATEDTTSLNDIRTHFLLGSAMRVLHDYPIITGQLTTIHGPVTQILHASLRDEFEQVKVTFDPVSLEDLSKVWTALSRPYRLSAAYTVSVVQIESRRLRRLPAPVLRRRVHMVISKRPTITSVYRRPAAPGDPIGDIRAHLGDELTIEGANFRAVQTYVKIGTLEPIGITPLSDTEIRFSIPDATYPIDADHLVTRPIPADDQLQPGAQSVEVQTLWQTEVIEGRPPGDPVLDPQDHGRLVNDQNRQSSNQSVFLLAPEITGVNPPSVVAGAVSGAILTATGRRLFRSGAKTVVLIGDVSIPVEEPGPGGPQSDTSIDVRLTALGLTTPPTPVGIYPVRIMVNGVESRETNVTLQLL